MTYNGYSKAILMKSFITKNYNRRNTPIQKQYTYKSRENYLKVNPLPAHQG